MKQLTWTETIIAIVAQETKKKEELDAFENWLKLELTKISTPCDFLKDLLAKIWLSNQIPEHYQRDLSDILKKYLTLNKCPK